jgi:putative ABC transport system substrate-binding protein
MTHHIVGMVVLLACGLLAASLPANAQEAGKIYRIGWLGPEPENDTFYTPFLDQLRDLGWVDGRHFVIEYQRAARSQFSARVHVLATELVRRNVDIIVAQSMPGCLAARAATATIPIVMAGCAHPEERGLIASLAQPGGNVTGLTNSPGPEFRGKMLELLKEVAPAISRVAILRNPLSPGEAPTPEEVEHEFKSWQTINLLYLSA